jgi:hypothetical protein
MYLSKNEIKYSKVRKYAVFHFYFDFSCRILVKFLA